MNPGGRSFLKLFDRQQNVEQGDIESGNARDRETDPPSDNHNEWLVVRWLLMSTNLSIPQYVSPVEIYQPAMISPLRLTRNYTVPQNTFSLIS